MEANPPDRRGVQMAEVEGWPHCLTEDETLDRLCAGWSISRFGDGELAIALGSGNCTHAANPKLAREFCEILLNPSAGCIPAIPTMRPGPKLMNWERSKARWSVLFDPRMEYGSVFVGQSLSAPWILNDAFMRKWRSIWAGKKVGLVSHEVSALTKLVEQDGATAVPILCLENEAYSQIDDVEQRCLGADVDLILICAGPMATALANRLAPKIQAIDFGRGLGVVLRYEFKAEG
jgi:hypothetical protein